MASTAAIVRVLLLAYVAAFLFVNIVAYLISNFYQKKFGQPAPTVGFVIAVVMAVLYGLSVAVPRQASPYTMEMVRVLLLLGCAVGSTWSAMGLYFTMKRIRK